MVGQCLEEGGARQSDRWGAVPPGGGRLFQYQPSCEVLRDYTGNGDVPGEADEECRGARNGEADAELSRGRRGGPAART